MNIFSIHTDSIDRRDFMRGFGDRLKKTKALVLYNKFFKIDRKLMSEWGIPYYNMSTDFWDLIKDSDDKYDVCIVFSIDKYYDIDRIKDINANNLIILGNKYYSPRFLAKNFDTDIENITSFDQNKDYFSKNQYFIRENSKFNTMEKDQIFTFITRDIKLNSLLG